MPKAVFLMFLAAFPLATLGGGYEIKDPGAAAAALYTVESAIRVDCDLGRDPCDDSSCEALRRDNAGRFPVSRMPWIAFDPQLIATGPSDQCKVKALKI